MKPILVGVDGGADALLEFDITRCYSWRYG